MFSIGFLRNFGAVSQELQILLQAGALFGFLGNAEENTTYQIGRCWAGLGWLIQSALFFVSGGY